MSRILPAILLGAVVCSGALADETPAAPCGESATVQPEDTLSRITARCGVPEAVILSANPGVEGSGDLHVGQTVSLKPAEPFAAFGRRVDSLASQANDALHSLADKIGDSAQDLLNRNPDLKARLGRLGTDLGVSGPASGAPVSLSPASGAVGSAVTVTASGLPKNSPVVLGAGPPAAAWQTLASAETSATGTIEASVRVPASLSSGSPAVFVVATPDGTVEGRSARFQVTR